VSPNTCLSWTKNTDDAGVTIGNPYVTTVGTWTDTGTGRCDTPMRLYCFGIDSKERLKIEPPLAARRAFVTIATHVIGSGLTGADALCQSEARAAGLPGTYLAFMATTGQSAGSRFNADGGPNWYRVDDIPLAATPAELLDAGPGWVP